MRDGRAGCTSCGRVRTPSLPSGGQNAVGVCSACGLPIEGNALSEFASRLARFGLGATPQPLLSRFPELPDAK